jgi:hypothetical protein
MLYAAEIVERIRNIPEGLCTWEFSEALPPVFTFLREHGSSGISPALTNKWIADRAVWVTHWQEDPMIPLYYLYDAEMETVDTAMLAHIAMTHKANIYQNSTNKSAYLAWKANERNWLGSLTVTNYSTEYPFNRWHQFADAEEVHSCVVGLVQHVRKKLRCFMRWTLQHENTLHVSAFDLRFGGPIVLFDSNLGEFTFRDEVALGRWIQKVQPYYPLYDAARCRFETFE